MGKRKRDLFRESFLDKELKDFFIEHSIALFNRKLMHNPVDKMIDTLFEDEPTAGVELERSSAVHDYTTDPQFKDAIKHGIVTLNMEWDRKGHYYSEYHLKYWNHSESDWNPMVHNPYFERNLFARATFFFRQVLILDNETIRNEKIRLMKPRAVWNNGTGQPEYWASWPIEYATIKNNIDNEWVIQTDDPRTHLPPISAEEKKKLEARREEIKAEAQAKEAQMKKEQEEREAEEKRKLGKPLNIVERREIARMTVPGFSSVLPKKADLDNFGVPQYESQVEKYYKKHPKIN